MSINAQLKRWRETSHHEIRWQRIRTRKGTASRLTWSPQDRSDSSSRQPSGVSPEIAARNDALSCNINALVVGGDGVRLTIVSRRRRAAPGDLK
jgi:hypothetical protein